MSPFSDRMAAIILLMASQSGKQTNYNAAQPGWKTAVNVENGQLANNKRYENQSIPVLPQRENGYSKWRTFPAYVLVIYFILCFVICPLLLKNPNPSRIVHLEKTDSSYYGMMWERINYPPGRGYIVKEVDRGGAADLSGMISKGDTIMNSYQKEGVLTVTVKTSYDDFLLRQTISLTVSLLLSCLICVSKREDMTEGPVRLVTLSRRAGSIEPDYGFGIKYTFGEWEVDKIIPGGPADLNGGIKRGDVLVRVNGVRIRHLEAETIKELMETRDNDVKLAIKSFN